MAWFFGKKKEEIAPQPAQKLAERPSEVPVRDSKTLKAMREEASQIEDRRHRGSIYKLKKDEILRAAVGYYANGETWLAREYIKYLVQYNTPVGEWTYYAINFFAFGKGNERPLTDKAAALVVRLINEQPGYEIKAADVIGVVYDYMADGVPVARYNVMTDQVMDGFKQRMVNVKYSVDDKAADSFVYLPQLATAYDYQAATDLKGMSLMGYTKSLGDKVKNLIEQKLDQDCAKYWLYQGHTTRAIETDPNKAWMCLKEAALNGYAPAVHEVYTKKQDKLTGAEKAQIAACMEKVQKEYIEYLGLMDPDNIESYSQLYERLANEQQQRDTEALREQLYQQASQLADADKAAPDMYKSAMLGNDDAYHWLVNYALEKELPLAQFVVAEWWMEEYRTGGDSQSLENARVLFEAARSGEIAEASWRMAQYYRDFYGTPAEGAFGPKELLEEAVAAGCVPAIMDYILDYSVEADYIKKLSRWLIENAGRDKYTYNRWCAMNAWRKIAKDRKLDLVTVAGAMANFCALFFSCREVGMSDYVVNYSAFSKKATVAEPHMYSGYAVSRAVCSLNGDSQMEIGEIFMENRGGKLTDVTDRWELAWTWFRLAEASYMRFAKQNNQYNTARLARLYSHNMLDVDKAWEYIRKSEEMHSVYVHALTYEDREFIGANMDDIIAMYKQWLSCDDDLAYKIAKASLDYMESIDSPLRDSAEQKKLRQSCMARLREAESKNTTYYINKEGYRPVYPVEDPADRLLFEKINSYSETMTTGFSKEEFSHIDDEAYLESSRLAELRERILEAVNKDLLAYL